MSAQTFRCCPHCADDQPHIEKDTHEVPCTLCYGDVERRIAAIAEAAREWRGTLDPSVSMADHVAAGNALVAAVDAEKTAQSRLDASSVPEPAAIGSGQTPLTFTVNAS